MKLVIDIPDGYADKALSGKYDLGSFCDLTIRKALINGTPLPKGVWSDAKVKHLVTGEIRNVRKCSECGTNYFVYDLENAVNEAPNFCPHCGADMRADGGEANMGRRIF